MKWTRLLLVVAAALLFISGADPVIHAACNGFPTQTVPFAFEQITVSTVSIGFTTATLSTGNYAIVTTETNPIRYRSDGVAPTAAVGHLAAAGSTIEVCGKAAASQFRMIRQGAADATAFATYYKGEQ
jgi:hypothetical protein